MKEKILNGYRLSFNEVKALMATWSNDALYALANELREHYLGRKLDTCMIQNAKSGKCSENCKWCSQSKYHQSDVEVYDLIDQAAVLTEAKVAAEKGVKMFSLVTSGRKLSPKNIAKVSGIIRTVKQTYPKLGCCASMGLLSKADLQALYDAGIRRYHCNIETAPSYFPTLCTTHTLEDKMQTIGWAKEVGLEVCSGGIIGMGESEEQRIEMAMFLRDNDIKSIPMNVLIPIAGTELQDAAPLSDEDILRSFALFRIINPTADIRFAGGRTRIHHIQDQALKAGVSASMVGNLLTTVGLDIDADMKHFKALNYDL